MSKQMALEYTIEKLLKKINLLKLKKLNSTWDHNLTKYYKYKELQACCQYNLSYINITQDY